MLSELAQDHSSGTLYGRLSRAEIARAAAGAKARLQAEMLGCAQRPFWRTKGSVASNGLAEPLQFRIGGCLVDPLEPSQTAWRRSRIKFQRGFVGLRKPSKARPRPIFGTTDKPGTQGISFDVSQHREEVIITFDGERFETALPDMPARVVVAEIAPDMRSEQPMHPSAQIPVALRPKGEMEMIRHQAIRQEAHRHPNRRLRHDLDKGSVIRGFMKHGSACVSAVDHMVRISADRTARGTRHSPPQGPRRT